VEERPVRRWDETVREVAVRQVAGGALREVASQEREMALCSSAYSVPEACHRASAAFAKLCTAAQDALITGGASYTDLSGFYGKGRS
jgi:hypothetical protein